jgi:hypothetical protein
MPDRKKEAGYAVGYQKPPKATRFQPGQSGNPKGRPKGTRSVGAILQEVVQQRVTVTENGKTRRLPAMEVAMRRLVNDAMRGEHNAIKLLLQLADRYSESPEAGRQLREILAEDQVILAQYMPKGAS